MQEVGKQAGVAGQIMAQKQAQQQQQAQNPEAVAQMAAQMLQSKGVAGLPANMGFKEGGIIGFDGEERSDVPAPNVPGMDKLMEIMANAEGTQVASTDNQAALQALAEAQKRLAAAAQSGNTRSAQLYAKQVADLRREIQYEPSTTPGEVVAQPMPRLSESNLPKTSSGMSLSSGIQSTEEIAQELAKAKKEKDLPKIGFLEKLLSSLQRLQTQPSGPQAPTLAETAGARLNEITQGGGAAVRGLANAIPPGLPSGSGIEQFRTAFADKKETESQQPGARVKVDPTQLEGYGVPAAGPAARPAARVEPQKPPARAAAPATQAPAPAGGATPDNVANRARGILSSFQAPTAESVMAGVGQYYKDTTEADIAKERALEDERAKLKAGMADLKAEGIAALEKDQATRKQLVASKAERDQFNRVQSFFRDLYTRGDSYGTVQAGIFAREEAERLAELNTSKAIIELKEAQKADKLGDVDRKLAAEQRYRGYTEKANQFKLQAAQIEGARQSNVYQTQGQAATTAANTLSHEKISADTLAAKRSELAQAREANKDNKAIAAANDAMGRLTNAWKVYEKAKDDNKMGLSISEEVASKDPAAKQLREAAIKAVTETYEKQVTPALTAYNILSQRAFGPDGTVAPSASAGSGINQSAAAAELARRQQK
jgi:hypothetical protein